MCCLCDIKPVDTPISRKVDKELKSLREAIINYDGKWELFKEKPSSQRF